MAEGRARARAGRYTLHGEIASGGMATVHYGQMVGAHGFSRVVAIKRMLPRLARDRRFHEMFVEEARLASRVQHPNVVPILDVLDEDGDVMIVMDYVNGAAFSTLLKRTVEAGERVPAPVVANIGCAMLAGLHAAHEARDRKGRPLGIVHRDVSPQNVLIGIDGVTRIMDFGIAKATELDGDDRMLTGKVCYMAPEQFRGEGADRRTDVFATAVVLWSALAGRRLFRSTDVDETIQEVLRCEVPALAEFRDDVPPELESTLRRALDPDRSKRYETAEDFAKAIEAASGLASTRAVADWVKQRVGSLLAERDEVVVHIEKTRTTMAVSLPRSEGDHTVSEMLTPEWVPPASVEAASVEAASVENATPVAVAPRTSRARVGLVVIASGVAVSLVAGVILLRATGESAKPTTGELPAVSTSEASNVPAETRPSTPAPVPTPTPTPSVTMSATPVASSKAPVATAKRKEPRGVPTSKKPTATTLEGVLPSRP